MLLILLKTPCILQKVDGGMFSLLCDLPKEFFDDKDTLLVAKDEVRASDEHVCDGHVDHLHGHVLPIDGVQVQS